MDSERNSLSIDLIEKVGEVKYLNIVSNSRDEGTVKEDFRDLIKQTYFDAESRSDPERITSKSLHRNKENLDGMMRFAFKNLEKTLKDFEIKIDGEGNFFMDVTKDSENFSITGNGQLVERDSRKLLIWPRNTKRIEVETRSRVFDAAAKTSLLKHWTEWVEKSLKE
ncbi:MAG: hypothetical protein EHM36_12430 [Deltaproteobacteria bacterium]|nr:MAG: hypothetical protein EHM36_12430 [Deltaproteobacteria bacterium]